MNNAVHEMIKIATNRMVEGQRAFLPLTESEDYKFEPTDFQKAVKLGFIPMTGGETPGGLYLTAILDAQEKLLTYFLTGGTVEGITEELLPVFLNDDIVVIIGTDLNFDLKVAFAVDKFDRSIDQVIHFPHYQSEWGLEEVIRQVFLNAKLYDTLFG